MERLKEIERRNIKIEKIQKTTWRKITLREREKQNDRKIER